MAFKDTLRFLTAFVARPGSIGAVAPSSRGLARRMVEWIEWQKTDVVVEYGPGTGAFTGEILARKKRDTRFFAVELEATLARTIETRFPDVKVYQESVANVKALCRKECVEQVDAIVSGLPWAAFPAKLQHELMDAMMTVLKPGGQFVTFAYLQGVLLPAGSRFKGLLHDRFSKVTRSPVVWRNLPPAFVYRCRR